MKLTRGFLLAAVMFLVLPAATTFGLDVGIIGDLGVTSKLGVGTTIPDEKVHILESIPGLSYPLKLDNQDITIGGTATGILFSTGGSGPARGKGALVYETTNTWNRGSFHFLQETSNNDFNPIISNAVLTIRNNGNIGIGETIPGVKLDVNGWIRARTGYGDTISIGGDSVNGDVEIQISAPAGRNKISLWNAQTQTGVDLGVRTISAESLNITGNITTAPKTSYLSIPPHAFRLVSNQYSNCAISTDTHTNDHDYIYYSGGLALWCDAYAPVSLPHGATITKFTSYWYYNVDSPTGAVATFYRGRFSEGNSYSPIAYTDVNGLFNGVREVSDTTIQNPVVNNQNYNYSVNMIIYDGSEMDAQFYGIVIEYTYSSP